MPFLRAVLTLLGVSLGVSCLLSAQKGAAPAPAAAWELTFSDEFNGAELDLAKWVPHEPSVPDPQAYTPEAVEVGGGQLHLVARGETSGMVTTFGTFAQTFGRFEVRCKVPAGPGLRPAFRLLPVPLASLPEIDIFETTGSAPAKVSFANHWGTEQTERSFGDSFPAPDLSAGFHVIAIEWDREKIAWFIDGKERFESADGVPQQQMFLKIDLAADHSSRSSPASFDVDYVRVYRRR